MMRTLSFAIAASLAATASCSKPATADPRMVSQWMHKLYGAIRAERLSPPVASRVMTYASTALYAGLVANDPTAPTLAGAMNGIPELPRAESGEEVDEVITSVVAERVVLDSLLHEALPTTHASFRVFSDSLVQTRASAGVKLDVRTRSEALGRRIGLAVVGWSRGDGFDSTRGRPYVAPVGPGLWVNDAPATIFASQNLSGASEFIALDNPANQMRTGNASDRSLILNRPKRTGVTTMPAVNMAGMSEPYWGQVRPFVLQRWNECPVPAPPAYAVDTSSAAYRDAVAVAQARAALTSDQRTIAFYWADNAGESGTPVGHWMSIASQMVSQRGLSAPEAARLMVLTSAAMADAFIASWGYKYKYSVHRPRPFIRSVIDSTWEPLIPTPPFPEYPSGHSTQSAAAASVLTAVIGPVAFEDSTGLSIGSAVRRFDSFRAAADEAGMSRVYGGIHFPSGNTGGQQLGRCIGDKVVERFKVTPAR